MNYAFVRFLFVGVMNTIVGLGMTYVFLDGFKLDYWIATFLGNAIGAIVSYFGNKRITFKSDAPLGKSMLLFVVVILTCYFISYSIGLQVASRLLYKVTWLPQDYSKEVAVLFGSGLYTVTNYFGQRHFVFPDKAKSKVQH